MMILKRIIIFLFSIIFVGSCIIFAQDLTDWNSILESADWGDALVIGGKGNLNFEYVRVDSLSVRALEKDQEHLSRVAAGVEVIIHNYENIKISFAFAGNKIRCDEISLNRLPTGRWYTQNWQWAHNGEKLDLLRLDGLGENGLIKPMGSIRTENVIPVNRFDPRHNGMKIMGSPVGDFLRGSLGDNRVEDLKVIGEEIQDNITCKVVSGHIVGNGDTITVWLAPSLMYRPKHVELNSGNEITIIHNTFREYSGGIWFPEIVQKYNYYLDEITSDRVLYTRETLAIQDNFEINIELPGTLFEVEFPRGLMVYDYRIGEKFEIK